MGFRKRFSKRLVSFFLLSACLALASCFGSDSRPQEKDYSCNVDPTGLSAVGSAGVVSTSDQEKFANKPVLPIYLNAQQDCPAKFTVDSSQSFQTMDGFGASFLEAGLKTLNTLPTATAQNDLLKKLFDKDDGAGFSIMKTVIGGTDFQSATPQWYTYAETPGDVTMSSFSIARDLEPNGLVTYIKRARQNGGDFILQAPMDYPPDWMLIDLNSNQNVNPIYFDALALYYAKYIEAYAAEGIQIDYLSPFNEPGVYTKIPIPAINTLIKNHIVPTFQNRNLTTKLMLSEADKRENAARDFKTFLNDPDTVQHISVVPFHGYDWANFDKTAALMRDYPNMKFWVTELCCLRWAPGGTTSYPGIKLANSIFSDIETGVSAWIFWNMILDETGGPWLVSPIHNNPEGNSQDSLVSINKFTHEIKYTELFFPIAHFSKFVRPQALRVSTSPQAFDSLRSLNFKNADGTNIAQLLNGSGKTITTQITFGRCSMYYSVPAMSISTIKWNDIAQCN